MTGHTLVLAKMDLREMEQFVLVNYNVKNICACGLFYLHLINFFSFITYFFKFIYFVIYSFVCSSIDLFIAFLSLVLQETF